MKAVHIPLVFMAEGVVEAVKGLKLLLFVLVRLLVMLAGDLKVVV